TGEGALEYVNQTEDLLRNVASLVRGTREDVVQRVQDNLDNVRALEKQVRALKDRLASGAGTDLATGAQDVAGVKVVATTVEGADAAALRTAVDQLKQRLKSAVIVLASVGEENRIAIVCGVTGDLTSRVKAGEVAGAVAAQVGGRGGGRADFAQAGGSNPAALPQALASVRQLVESKLAA